MKKRFANSPHENGQLKDMPVTGEAGEITRLLSDWGNGDPEALFQLIPIAYQELRKTARGFISGANATLQPTALVNELYLRLVDREPQKLRNRKEFFAFAGRVMRNLLLDYIRGKMTSKRGGKMTRLSIAELVDLPDKDAPDPLQLIALDDALGRLEEVDPLMCQIVELWYFSGLTVKETAAALGLSTAKVKRERAMAKSWLAGQFSNNN